MKVGDKVYITTNSSRDIHLAGIQTVTKVGNKYFEIESTPWEKFLVNTEKDEHPSGYSPNTGIRTKDSYVSQLEWWPSKEVWEKNQKAKACRDYISKNLYLMDDDEVIDFAELLTEKERLCGMR